MLIYQRCLRVCGVSRYRHSLSQSASQLKTWFVQATAHHKALVSMGNAFVASVSKVKLASASPAGTAAGTEVVVKLTAHVCALSSSTQQSWEWSQSARTKIGSLQVLVETIRPGTTPPRIVILCSARMTVQGTELVVSLAAHATLATLATIARCCHVHTCVERTERASMVRVSVTQDSKVHLVLGSPWALSWCVTASSLRRVLQTLAQQPRQ
eukprot:COSAG06_NODE_1562_length_9097_cov_2.940765_6_plen_212_part_00